MTAGPSVEPVTRGPSATVIAAPGVIRVPEEVDLTQDSDEVSQLIDYFKYILNYAKILLLYFRKMI